MFRFFLLYFTRTCWSSGSSNGATDLQRNFLIKYIFAYASYKKAAMVWKTFYKIIPEFVEVQLRLFLLFASGVIGFSVFEFKIEMLFL